MLDLIGLAEMFVHDASKQGHTSTQIAKALEGALLPLREKEKEAGHQQAAKDWDFKSVEDALTEAMAEFWGMSYNMDDLQLELKLRFPRHHKSIDNIFEWAGDVSNEREEMGKHGPSAEYERGFSKVINALKRLPW